MTLTKTHYYIAGWVITGIAAMVIILSLSNKRNTKEDYYKELLAAKQETIDLLQSQRATLQQMHTDVLDYARQSDRRDSLILQQILANQQHYQNLNQRYAQIPARIARLSANVDSLLAAYRQY